MLEVQYYEKVQYGERKFQNSIVIIVSKREQIVVSKFSKTRNHCLKDTDGVGKIGQVCLCLVYQIINGLVQIGRIYSFK